MSEIRIGIIGFGRIGAEHAGWIASAGGIRAVAAADPTAARRQLAARRKLAVVEDEASLLKDSSIAAVLVSTPTAMHFEHAMTALKAGKHVMVEKPLALDLEQAKILVSEARKRKKILSVFHNRRWDVDYLTVLSAVRSGMFGKIINVESRLGQFASCVGPAAKEYHPTWRNEAAYGGGGLYDWGSHFVDQMWRMMLPARPVRVFAQLRGNVWTTDCDDFARVCIDFDSGACGLVEINTTTTRPPARWHIDGTAGSAESPYSLEYDVRKWAEVEFVSIEGKKKKLRAAAEGLSETTIWEKFAAAVRGEGEPAVTAKSVLPTMALLDAARISSTLGMAMQLGSVEWTE